MLLIYCYGNILLMHLCINILYIFYISKKTRELTGFKKLFTCWEKVWVFKFSPQKYSYTCECNFKSYLLNEICLPISTWTYIRLYLSYIGRLHSGVYSVQRVVYFSVFLLTKQNILAILYHIVYIYIIYCNIYIGRYILTGLFACG